MRMFSMLAEPVRRWFRPLPLGKRGERAAARWLRMKGYVIIAVGERTSAGELDIIAVDGRTIVFVEVKTRRSHAAGLPAEAVDDRKQRRLTHTALAYLKRRDLLGYAARFDVVAITWPDDAKPPAIEHIINAFSPPGQGQMFA